MRKASAVCAFVALLACVAAEAQAGPLATLPEQVVALVEIGDVGALDQAVSTYAAMASPAGPIPPLAYVLPASVLKTVDPLSVDMNRPFRILVLAPPLHLKPVFVFGVPDPAEYLQSLAPGIKKVADQGDLHVFTDGDRTIVIGTAGKRAVLGQDPQAVGEALRLLKAGSIPDGPVFTDCRAGAAVRVQKLLHDLDALGQNPFAQFLQVVAAQARTDPEAAQIQRVLEAELKGIESVLRQTVALSASIKLDGGDLTLVFEAAPAPASGLAKYISSVPTGEPKLLPYVPADSVGVFAFKVGDLGPFLDWSMGIVRAMVRPGEGETEAGALSELARAALNAAGKEVAVAFGGKDSLVITRAVEVRDKAALEQVMPRLLRQVEKAMKNATIGGVYGLDVQQNATSHAGHAISSVTFELGMPAAPNVPPQLAEAHRLMLDMFLGKERKGYWSYKGDVMLYTQGDGALDELKALLDGSDPGFAGSEGHKAVTEGAPAATMAVGYLSLGKLGNLVLGLWKRLAQAQGQTVPLQAAAIKFEEGPPVGLLVRVTPEGAVEKRVRIPAGAIRVIYDGITRALQSGAAPGSAVEGGG